MFAYGSLMGDAVLGSYRARPARLTGFHRAFLHESRKRWGSAVAPCPILGLAAGGECWGLVFEVPDADRRVVENALARREAAGERQRETRGVETAEGPVDATVWVSRSPGGNGAVDLPAVEARLRGAHGAVGNGTEYVRTVAHALGLHGIEDPLVDTLWRRLQE